MLISFENNLTPQWVKILAANCWQIEYCKDDPSYKKHMDLNGLYMSRFLAARAKKDFPTVGEGMFEIEGLLDIDVISDTDHDGGSMYYFRYKNPQWNGWSYKEGEEYPPPNYNILHHEWLSAGGWECAVHMYGAPKTARDTAIELQRLRSLTGK